jgi:hypothetical protein
MRIKGLAAGAAMLAAALLTAAGARAGEDELIATARKTLEAHKDCIVQVRLVLKTTMYFNGQQANQREQKVEVNGTTIDPSGLTVISNTATDPMSRFAGQIAAAGGGNFKQETKVTDVKVVLSDGKEYPAKVVLRDKDLDLAFVRPDEAGLKLPCLKLAKAPAPEVLEPVIGITRLDRAANREPAVMTGQIMSIIKKPRVRYVTMTLVDTGCPIFDKQGRVLGLSLMRQGTADISGTFSLMGFMPSVLPCEDILEAAGQVPAANAAKE